MQAHRRVVDAVKRDLEKPNDPWYYLWTSVVLVVSCGILVVGGDILAGVLLMLFPAFTIYITIRAFKRRRR